MIIDVGNNGRCKSLAQITVYVGQGAKTRAEKTWAEGVDPILKTWVWKPVTTAGISTQNQL